MPGFKDDLLQLAASSGISRKEFEAVGIQAWPAIMRKIEAAFVLKTSATTRFNWWWESFKGPQYRLFFDTAWAVDYLTQLVDEHEQIWLVACDTDQDPSKFWLFQGTVQATQWLLQEHCYFEYYLVSKKYQWLLCETDHDVLIGLGSAIPRMQQLDAPGSIVLPEASRSTLKQKDKAA
ncbi:hypothetical protein GO988_23625 [Hymenobacter sp. HMF4947]|uniref:Uncharacterized protein n=1 Tax=Hymenobacter ginkgonis TaxID=2682976 RepID=A0A7K1TLU4_9BACT|nr:DUF6756 family protein [Hymenobacter ginkgonis]MVN79332.1 hypothetical protein [Hymenobacter ginkgonis]